MTFTTNGADFRNKILTDSIEAGQDLREYRFYTVFSFDYISYPNIKSKRAIITEKVEKPIRPIINIAHTYKNRYA